MLVVSWAIAVWHNDSLCVLLNILINATRDIFQFARQNKNTKNEHAQIKRKKIWRKSMRKRVSSFNVYIVVSAFLLQLAPKLAGRTSMLNVFIFFFNFKIFPSPLCSKLSSSSLLSTHKSSHWMCSTEKVVLKKFATFIGKHLCQTHFLIKLQA